MEGGGHTRDPGAPLRVLIVEDSPVVAEFLRYVLGADPGLEVVGVEADGVAGIDAVARLRPDVVTMDIHMPRMSGLEATSRIMAEHPVPIVVVSGTVDDEVQTTFHCLEVGALAFVPRPEGIGSPHYAETTAQLVETVKLMAEVRVVRRRARQVETPPEKVSPIRHTQYTPGSARVVAIGASAGGPQCVQKLLGELPPDFSLPVLLVQHMVPDFVPGFAQWLGSSCSLTVKLAENGEGLQPGCVYVAPGDRQMGVERGGRLFIVDSPPENGHRPSVSFLFRAVNDAFGRAALSILLTGMGRDGAEELSRMRDRGALTFAQDRASSLVYGMPGEAVRLGAARHVLPPAEIGTLLKKISAEKERWKE